MRDLTEEWQRCYGSIAEGFDAEVKNGMCCDSRLRVPYTSMVFSTVTAVGGGAPAVSSSIVHAMKKKKQYQPTMFEVPNPVRLMSLVQVTRFLLKRLPRTTVLAKNIEFQSCFTGLDLHKALQDWLHLPLEKAETFSKQLLDKSVIACIAQSTTNHPDESIYRLHALDKPHILNRASPAIVSNDVTLKTPLQVLLSLCEVLQKVFDDHVTEHDMMQSMTYHYFDEAVARLQNMKLPEDPLFLTNLYNLMVRHALIEWDQGHWQSLLGQIQYQFDGMVVTLADISARLAAPRKRSKLSLFRCTTAKALSRYDARYQLLCSRGTRSSPKIQIYETEEDVTAAVKQFVQDRVEFSGRKMRIPQVFASIFDEQQNLMEWLVAFLSPHQLKLLALDHDQIEVAYLHYDWTRTTDLYTRRAKSEPVLIKPPPRRSISPVRRFSEMGQTPLNAISSFAPVYVPESIKELEVKCSSRSTSPTFSNTTGLSTPTGNNSPEWCTKQTLSNLSGPPVVSLSSE